MPKKSDKYDPKNSPALENRDENYPAHWRDWGARGKVPESVFVIKDVPARDGMGFQPRSGTRYDAYVLSDGTVYAVNHGGQRAKLEKGEYTVISFHGSPVMEVVQPILAIVERHEHLVELLDSIMATVLLPDNRSHINANLLKYFEEIEARYKWIMEK